ncbi:MAG: TolC family protein, partial [bacterium]
GDTLRAEIACGTIHQQQADTAARLVARRADLADLLGLPPDIPFDALSGPQFVVSAPAANDAAVVALSNRLDYAQILQDIDDARRGVRIARQTLLPDLELASRYERQGQGDTVKDGLSLNHNAWMVGVRLLSDFPPRAEQRALSQAEITERVTRLRADTVQSAIRRQVVQALDVLHRSEGDLPLATTTLAAARQRLELMRRLYSSARATTFDVSDAETQWRDADERWLAASSSVTVAAYRLLWTLGTLTDVPNSLKAGSEPTT